MKLGRSLRGTPNYASLNVHEGMECSRRDDLEALCYMLISLHVGRLPWSCVREKTLALKLKKIAEMKKELELSKICSGCPEAIYKMLMYCRQLDYDEEPNYSKLQEFFEK